MHTPPLDKPIAPPPSVSVGGRTMSAVVQDRYGSEPADVLHLAVIDKPTVATGQVLVRVQAASVDRGTWHIMAGLPYPIRLAGFGLRRPKYANPGRNLAGTVEAIGADVTTFAPGDEVFGTATSTFAEYAVAEPGKLSLKPANLSFDQAAAVPVSGSTALQAVRDHGRVQAGEKVLILGASGGVGSFAVQIAKAFGAEVTGVASTAKLDLVRSLGADHVVDHTREDVADGGPRFDVILDIGGNAGLGRLRQALTPRGRLVIVGGETAGRLLGGSGRQIRAALMSPFVSQTLGTFIATENAADLTALVELIEAGQVAPAVDRAYPLAETAAAIRHLLDGRARGKLVVSVSPADMPTPGSRSTE
jgi:NADPH:quinone reductase-like Zn-dependent oxidoreductase